MSATTSFRTDNDHVGRLKEHVGQDTIPDWILGQIEGG